MYLGDTSQMVPSHIGYYHKCDIIACIFTSNDQYTITCDEEGLIRFINTGTGYERSCYLTSRACERLLITRAKVTQLLTVKKDTVLVYGTEDGCIGVYQVQIGEVLSFTKLFASVEIRIENDACRQSRVWKCFVTIVL